MDTPGLTSFLDYDFEGDGSPESVIKAPIGATYRNITGGAIWQKTTGPHLSTGWILSSTASGPAVKTRYAIVGNSWSTDGASPPWPTYFARTANHLNDLVLNLAVSGESLTQTIAKFDTDIAPYAEAITGIRLIIIFPCMGGVEAYDAATPDAIELLVNQYIAKAHAIGAQVVVGNIAAGTLFTVGARENARVAMNDRFSTNRATYDFFWDIASRFNDYLSVLYEDDQHPSALGCLLNAIDADRALSGEYLNTSAVAALDSSYIAPGTVTLKNNSGTTIITIDGNGHIITTGGVTVGNVGGGFAGAGLRIGSQGAVIGTLAGATSALYMRSGGAGWEFYNLVNQRIFGFAEDGKFDYAGDVGFFREAAGILRITNGSTGRGGLVWQRRYAASSPTTGGTVNATDNAEDQLLDLTPAGTLATLTVNLPSNANSINGQRFTLFISQIITTLTMASSGATFVNGASAWAANDCITWIKMGTRWIREA